MNILLSGSSDKITRIWLHGTYKLLSIKNLVRLVPVTNVPCNCNGILVTGTGSTKGGQFSVRRMNRLGYIAFTKELISDFLT